MGQLFVTGASGFIGRRLLARIPAGRYERVVALSRGERPAEPGVTWVRGDVRTPGGWQKHLSKHTDVAHLAAATGGASATEHRATNAEGTEALVRACERTGVGGLLFVSSIAARFSDDPRYPYATSKKEAEVIVRGATVPFTIVRPTIVLGDGSPILARLRTLACGPVVAVIGDGKTRVQPVDVTDVTEGLLLVLERRAFDGVTREFGGPEVLTMEQLLIRVRAAAGLASARVMHVPYGPVRTGLIALEALLRSRSPVSAGQVSSFVKDGVAEPDALWAELAPRLAPIEQMVGGKPRRD